MVELRKRKAAEAPAPPPLTKRPSSVKSAPSKGKAAATENKDASTNGASSSSKVTTGNTIDLDEFGGEVVTNEGEKTTLKKLVDDSKGGVVLFTYPKASTPGCRFSVSQRLSKFCAAYLIFNLLQQSNDYLEINSNRHYSGLPFQRRLQAIDRNGVLYLRALH